MVGVSRSTYYRRRNQEHLSNGSRSHVRVAPDLRRRVIDLAKKHPLYGYRKVWALLGDDRHRVSKSTVYRWLKAEDLLLDPGYHM